MRWHLFFLQKLDPNWFTLVSTRNNNLQEKNTHLGWGCDCRILHDWAIRDVHGDVSIVDEYPGAVHPTRLVPSFERLQVRITEQAAESKLEGAKVFAAGAQRLARRGGAAMGRLAGRPFAWTRLAPIAAARAMLVLQLAGHEVGGVESQVAATANRVCLQALAVRPQDRAVRRRLLRLDDSRVLYR